ncbi:GyrI-like domain-containing protein [Lutimonas halocynthiae]|uniref:GyrI-like domain-containing protein n=1 Tax=Lutimonas halocynthiae TaxID=1446477 RepID=UPI0025B532FD|nr:GyrI-like domain-containing protein [Lutimonas halocynthiae]MDN3643540.1 GyrI-like domain-containing protein [Lutimonas halocynthiae]
MLKKIILFLCVVLSGFLVWSLFLKPYDYLVTFKVNTIPGVVNQSLKLWNSSIEGAKIEASEDLFDLKQIVSYNDSTFQYHYHIEPINDSTSLVNVYVTDMEHSFQNRLTHPFSHTDFEKRVKNSMVDFSDKLKEHISRFKVKIEGESEIKEVFCAFVSIESKQIEKAMGMMQNYNLLSSTLIANKIELNGRPFISVNNWDMKNDRIQYDFCYPIKNNDSLFQHPMISFKKINRKKALKAIYNGNYITSDRAWYALLNYAEKNNIAVEKKPFEVFHNNPNMGGDELQWITEIYMPIAN